MLLLLDEIACLDQVTNFHRFFTSYASGVRVLPEWRIIANDTDYADFWVAIGGWDLSESGFTGFWDFRDGLVSNRGYSKARKYVDTLKNAEPLSTKCCIFLGYLF